jgi:Pyridoxamine 5'-phosphate oxidase
MTDRFHVVRLYIQAQAERTEDNAEALAGALAADVFLKTSRATFEGRAMVLEQVGLPLTAPGFRQADWSEPQADGNSVRVSGLLPITALQGGFDLRFDFRDDGLVNRIEQITLPAPPLPPSQLRLSNDMKQLIKDAWVAAPIMVVSVDPTGQARVTLRGTVQPISDDKLAFWARNAEGGTVGALDTNPKLTLFYRNPQIRTTVSFYGRGRVTKDEKERLAIYDNSPEPERAADPEQRGVAVVVDLDKVEGTTQNGRIHMVRGAPG